MISLPFYDPFKRHSVEIGRSVIIVVHNVYLMIIIAIFVPMLDKYNNFSHCFFAPLLHRVASHPPTIHPVIVTTEPSNDVLDDNDNKEAVTDDTHANNVVNVVDKSNFTWIWHVLHLFHWFYVWLEPFIGGFMAFFMFLLNCAAFPILNACFRVFRRHLRNNLIQWHLPFSVDNKYQSNLNEIGKYEHKSSLDSLNNKGFSWTTDHIGYNLGKCHRLAPSLTWNLIKSHYFDGQ